MDGSANVVPSGLFHYLLFEANAHICFIGLTWQSLRNKLPSRPFSLFPQVG